MTWGGQFSLCIASLSCTVTETDVKHGREDLLWPTVGRDTVHCGRNGKAVGGDDGLFISGESGSKDLKPKLGAAYNF